MPPIGPRRQVEQSAPEDPGAVELDHLDERVEVWCRPLEVVLVELQVPIALVQRPLLANLRVAEPTDREPGPLRAEILAPRWPTFEHGDGAVCHVDLVADLVTGPASTTRRSADPLTDPGEVEIGDHKSSKVNGNAGEGDDQP